MLRKCVLLSFISLSLLGCSNRYTEATALYQAGKTAYERQDYSQAFQRLFLAANKGNSNAQYAVGYMLYKGLGVPRDQTQALHWLQKAAKQGHPSAIRALKQLDTQANNEIFAKES